MNKNDQTGNMTLIDGYIIMTVNLSEKVCYVYMNHY